MYIDFRDVCVHVHECWFFIRTFCLFNFALKKKPLCWSLVLQISVPLFMPIKHILIIIVSSICFFFLNRIQSILIVYLRQNEDWSWHSFAIASNMLWVSQTKKGISNGCVRYLISLMHFPIHFLFFFFRFLISANCNIMNFVYSFPLYFFVSESSTSFNEKTILSIVFCFSCTFVTCSRFISNFPYFVSILFSCAVLFCSNFLLFIVYVSLSKLCSVHSIVLLLVKWSSHTHTLTHLHTNTCSRLQKHINVYTDTNITRLMVILFFFWASITSKLLLFVCQTELLCHSTKSKMLGG